MFDLNLNISGDAQEKINRLSAKVKDFKPELEGDISIIMMRSFDKNFTNGGRPNKWPESKAAIARSGQTLIDSGRLRRSLSTRGNPDQFYEVGKLNLKIGTTVPYAITHNNGLTVKIFGRTNYKFPERPFVLIQPEDEVAINQVIIKGIEDVLI
jgi:phage gpG-like protein